MQLSASPIGFDAHNAHACAVASQLTYNAPELVASTVVGDWNFPRFRKLDSGIAQGFVAANDELTLLTFRGTERDFDDWYENLDTELVPGPFSAGERAHRGWFLGLGLVMSDIEAKIDALSAPGAPLLITGHSLGAALATLTAAMFFNARRPVHSVYAFGAPRVGCRNFRDVYKDYDQGRTFRIVNRHDIVARIPPRLLKYRHVGSMRYLDEDGAIHEDLNFWERMLIYLDPAGRDAKSYINALADRLPGALDDHRAESYVRKLAKLVSG